MKHSSINRREFVVAAAVGVTSLARGYAAPPEALSQPTSGTPGRYQVLRGAEAELTEAIVNALCPEDATTPSGVACGLSRAIDQALGGPWGSSPAVVPGLNQRQLYSTASAAANQAAIDEFGKGLTQLDPGSTSALIARMLSGQLDSEAAPLQVWLRKQILPILKRASFAEPIYSSYSNRVHWKIFG